MALKQVPLFDTAFDADEQRAVESVLCSGWLTMGERTGEFERRFAGHIGVKHAVAVSSGSAALHLAHKVLCGGNGEEVICPSLTFVAGASGILHAGAVPVFADIVGIDDFSISAADIEAKITRRTRALQVTHYAGYPCDMTRILEIAERYDLRIVEDCAHAPAADFLGKRCGSLGDLGCFSFFSNKNMTTGEGGMITTDDDRLAERIRALRSHGMTRPTMDRERRHAYNYDVVDLGFNYRIDEMRAAMGIVQLDKLVAKDEQRRRLAEAYRVRLEAVEKVQVPYGGKTGRYACHIFPIVLGGEIERSEVMEYMAIKGIQTSIHYPPVHQFNFFRHRLGSGPLPMTEEVCRRELTLPLYPHMEMEDLHYVCDVLLEALQRGGSSS